MDYETQIVTRRSRGRLVALALVAVILILLAVLWIQRKTIAADFIDRELERRGVRASYQIKELGFGSQRLENVVIGNPARPDLTARWVEVRLSYGLRAPRVRKITARGVRMFGRLVDGKLSLGQIDRLLPAPTGAPFRLPALELDLADAAMALETPAGRIGVALEGKGRLRDGFRGKTAMLSRRLSFGECRIDAPVASLTVSVADERPRFQGPIRSARAGCGDDLDLIKPVLTIDTSFKPALDGWIGGASVGAEVARSGSNALSGVRGRLTFAGDRKRTRGAMDLAAAGGSAPGLRSGQLSVDGRYDFSMATGRLGFSGSTALRSVVASDTFVRGQLGLLSSLGGTPLEPLGRALQDAATRAGRNFDLQGRFSLARQGSRGLLRITNIDANSGSGARLSLTGGEGVSYAWPAGASRVHGSVALEGGGFPTTRASLLQAKAGGPMQGTLRVAPFAANGARLALGEVSFGPDGRGATRVETIARIDGPFSGGRVDGLVLPIRGRFGGGAFLFGEGCTTAAFRALRYSSLVLRPTRLELCPIGKALISRSARGTLQGGAVVARPSLAGRLGSSPITLAAHRFRFDLGASSFSSSAVRVRLGKAGHINRFDFATLKGGFEGRGVRGTFAGGDAKLANVPLLVSSARGRWQVVGGRTVVDGALTVADEAAPSRFYPLRSDDFHLTLVNNRIDATAWLFDPETGTRITRATIVHALNSGRGHAQLDIPGIVFNQAYQPEQLTRLTTGVVALVDGVLTGQGEIKWSPEGASSSGTFSTQDMDLAATFGPITGLTTTINFTDLLGLQTAPGQIAQVKRIQAGIDVFDGRIAYQLLPDLKVRVQSGRWPFAGGELILQETVLDFGRPSAKHLTFKVVGMDAAAFVQQMEFSNISATGTFDGIIPMVFDERGGRIVAGHLEARPGGGVVSYIGELTDKQLGAYGKLAFDALKSLRYSRLTVDLDGSLDAEFLTRVELDGVARDPTIVPASGGGIRDMVAGRALGQLAKIPFEFNITVRGPFRSLIGTMRSLDDPSQLIQAVLPPELRDQPTTTNVQRPESEDMR